MLAASVHVAEGDLVLALIILLISGLIAAAVLYVGRRSWPEAAGPAAFIVFVIGALIALFTAL